MEGVAYEYHYYLSVLKTLYPNNRFENMYGTGGGAKSEVFNQIKSDVLGLNVIPFSMGDTALVGSAVIAGVGAGVFSDYREPIRKVMHPAKTLHPDMEKHAVYADYAATYLKTIEALTGVYQSKIYR